MMMMKSFFIDKFVLQGVYGIFLNDESIDESCLAVFMVEMYVECFCY